MDYPHLIYHLAVLRLERLRLAAQVNPNSNCYDFGHMFLYVENKMVQRSKGIKDTVLKEIVLSIYRQFLDMQRDLGRSQDVDPRYIVYISL